MMYMNSVGKPLAVAVLIFACIQQVVSLATNVCLSKWSDDTDHAVSQGTYLGVYASLGIGQGEWNIVFISSYYSESTHTYVTAYLLSHRSPSLHLSLSLLPPSFPSPSCPSPSYPSPPLPAPHLGSPFLT